MKLVLARLVRTDRGGALHVHGLADTWGTRHDAVTTAPYPDNNSRRLVTVGAAAQSQNGGGLELPDVITVYDGERPPEPRRGYWDQITALDWFISPVWGLLKLVITETAQAIGGGQESPVVAVHESQLGRAKFPPGHPQPRHVYIRSDIGASRYLVAATNELEQLQEQLSTYIQALANLGAKRIEIDAVLADDSNVGVGIKGFGERVSASFSDERSGSARVEYRIDLPGHEAQPPRMGGWLNTPEWRALARTRVEHAATSFEYHFTASRKHVLTADLASKIAGAGFNLGGNYKTVGSTEFRVQAVF